MTTEEKKPFLKSAIGLAVSVGALFLSIWVISKALKAGQK